MNMNEMPQRELHKRYMASLDDVGIGAKDGRKMWQDANGFPASTAHWTRDDYLRAIALILEPVVAEFRRKCEAHEIDPDAFVDLIWKDDTWLRVCDYQAAIAMLDIIPDVTDRINLAATRHEDLGPQLLADD